MRFQCDDHAKVCPGTRKFREIVRDLLAVGIELFRKAESHGHHTRWSGWSRQAHREFHARDHPGARMGTHRRVGLKQVSVACDRRQFQSGVVKRAPDIPHLGIGHRHRVEGIRIPADQFDGLVAQSVHQ